MKNYLYYALLLLVMIPSSCRKENADIPDIDSGDQPGNVISYSTIDDKPLLLADINAFSAPYVATYYENGQGVLLFDGDIDSFEDSAFQNKSELKSITLPYTLKNISDKAFQGCSNLEKISFQNKSSLEKLGKYAFSGCSKLSEFEFPNSLQTIDDYAFEGTSLVDLDFRKVSESINLSEKAFGDKHGFITIWARDIAAVQSYRARFGSLSKYVTTSDLTGINGSNWTEYLPQCLNLRDLTIPCTHDAATWYADWTTPWNDILKDQGLTYKETFEQGVRAFDLRLGAKYHATPQSIKPIEFDFFVHGDQGWFSELNSFPDGMSYFPSKDMFKNSFLILFAKDDYDSASKLKLSCFTAFVENLNSPAGYDYGQFIAYNPDLTLEDVKGKILLFTRTTEYLGYKEKDIPINFLTDNSIQVYRNGSPVDGALYDSFTQDHYEVDHAYDKYDIICNTLKERKGSGDRSFFIEQFNACQYGSIAGLADGYFFSWPVICYVNTSVSDDLSKVDLGTYYRQPLGVVFYDMCGVNRYNDDYVFNGDKLAPLLWKHNFRGFWDVSHNL